MTVTNLREERDRRNRQRIIIEAQRRRHAADVRRQDRRDSDRRAARRATATGAAAQGCSTMVTVALLAGGLALCVVAKRVWP